MTATTTTTDRDTNDPLDRFVRAQAPVYADVLAELRRCRKQTHWMWFVFPQLKELGRSSTAQHFGIASADEARAYLRHPLLGARLRECAALLLACSGNDAQRIMGTPDDLKLRSCMTLFAAVAPQEPVFNQVLDKLHAGAADGATLSLLAQPSSRGQTRLTEQGQAVHSAVRIKRTMDNTEDSADPHEAIMADKAASGDDNPNDPSGIQRSHLDFPVVGLGASAGGLAALIRFFEAMPAAPEMAFVVIMHLSPKHKSEAAQILQRSTPLPVQQVTGSVPVERNHVYVIPPTQQLSMTDGMLCMAPEQRQQGRHVAIDVFFRTLAAAHRERAVGVVLSGTGADGAVGIGRIKENGGVTFAQAPDDAEYDGMPRAAIATGQVDFVLAATDMPAQLVTLARTASKIRLPADVAQQVRAQPSEGDDAARDEEALRDVMQMLRSRTHHDFRLYKRATVLRRIERRMQVCGATSLQGYRKHLADNPRETPALLQDLLISVTNFFRDREAFEALERDVLPDLVAGMPPGQPLRAWVAGCATGEEAYSVAMLLQEAAERQPQHQQPPDGLGFQLFATDIDDRALRIGREGLYPQPVAGDMAPARLRQHMVREQDHYRMHKSLRDRVLFAHHNVLRDPPFSRLQFIACRNLLIYLQRDAQARVLETFRFALAPGGVLFLGSSESVEVVPDMFEPIDKRHRLYRVLAPTTWHRTQPLGLGGPHSALPLGGTGNGAVNGAGPADGAQRIAHRAVDHHALTLLPERRQLRLAELHQRALRSVMPASVLLDADQNILHFSEGAGRFLVPQAGVPSLSLMNNIEPALRLELRAALFKAQRSGTAAEARALRPAADTGQPGTADTTATTPAAPRSTFVQMVVRVFDDAETHTRTLLVTLDDSNQRAADSADRTTGSGEQRVGTDVVVGELDAENARLKERLQTTLEQAETSTEELKSSNEELQAINEELRSATEELETSKEELQSVNEELVTVNHELANKVDETSRINDDLQNFIASTDIATVFVDASMRVKRYTPPASTLFNLIATDVGRSLLDLTHHLVYDELAADAEAAFHNLQPVEREVRARDGRHFLARCMPYRTLENRIEGVVMTFIDVTARRSAEQAASQGAEDLRQAMEAVKDFAIIVTDEHGAITQWNQGAERIFGHAAAEIIGQPTAVLFTEQDRAAGVPQQEMRTAAEKGRAEDERWHIRKDGSTFYCSGVMTGFARAHMTGFAKIARDMTGSKQAELARELLLTQAQHGRREAQAAVAAKDQFLAVMSHELKHPLNLIGLNAELLLRLPQVRTAEAAVHAAQTIQRTVTAQAKIVDDLLDLSRARTGKLTLQLMPIDWAATVRAIVDAVQVDASGKGVALTLACPDEPLHGMFDRVRAEQVVWNLLSNALKFTPTGGTIHVSLVAEGAGVRLTVADSGKGIEQAFIDHVFEMFSQESSLERRREGGMGVGLALVRELVTAHGGTVTAESPGPGLGATFTLWVPRGNARGLADLPSDDDAGKLNGLRLLLVDDSADTVLPLGALLRLSGADVHTAVGGVEALRLLDESGPYDVLVSDISMPEVSGLELVRNLRARGGVQPIAIACSGYARAQDRQGALDAGFDAKLDKPLSLGQLEETILALRAGRAGRTAG